MKRNQTIIYILSLIILAIGASYMGYKAYDNLGVMVCSVVVVLFPSIYSLIPLVQEQLHNKNQLKNRLTDITFTDRYEDLTDIITKISTPEHILEIKGTDKQCGKTWLAKRLCDYINFPKDQNNSDIKVKCPYKKAYYLDMDSCSEKDLNNFFQSEYVTPKVVIIFDHVKDLSILISKQYLYHFQMVYILKDSGDYSHQFHIMTEFKSQYIEELQTKIQKNYPKISSLSKNEIDILYRLTGGNIRKIYLLLCEQKCIKWIKDIANNRQTDYDIKLNDIQLTLYIGEYKKAKKKLIDFKIEYEEMFDKNNDLYFKYILMLSDCEHLLNNYEDATNLLTILEDERFLSSNIEFKNEICKAHYLKHLWKCNEALIILNQLKAKSYTAMVDSLGILVAKYFINDLYVPDSQQNSLEEFFNIYILAENSTLKHDEEDALKLKRYNAIYLFYLEHPIEPDSLLESITKVIEIYRAQNNRLLANAYFINGEIKRLYHCYDGAIYLYKKCLEVTQDDNITLQVNLMMHYLKHCKKVNIEFDILPLKKIRDLCSKNNYAQKLYQRIRCLELNDPNANQVQECFDNRIMPIL